MKTAKTIFFLLCVIFGNFATPGSFTAIYSAILAGYLAIECIRNMDKKKK